MTMNADVLAARYALGTLGDGWVEACRIAEGLAEGRISLPEVDAVAETEGLREYVPAAVLDRATVKSKAVLRLWDTAEGNTTPDPLEALRGMLTNPAAGMPPAAAGGKETAMQLSLQAAMAAAGGEHDAKAKELGEKAEKAQKIEASRTYFALVAALGDKAPAAAWQQVKDLAFTACG